MGRECLSCIEDLKRARSGALLNIGCSRNSLYNFQNWVLIMKEVASCKWIKGPPKQIMSLTMSRSAFQNLIGCEFKKFDEDQWIEWATGFESESIGQIVIVEYEGFPDTLVVWGEQDIDTEFGSKKILEEFQLSEELVEHVRMAKKSIM
jgi:hypothetical protein